MQKRIWQRAASLSACLVGAVSAQAQQQVGYCNPLNLSYRFQLKEVAKTAPAREAADPSVALYQGEYWLLASKSGGYWHSKDLSHWQFVPTHQLPTEDYAPDVRIINNMLYTIAFGGKIFRTTDPADDKWELVGHPFGTPDPNLFQDDDGRIYLYYGCSNKKPICGVELDPQTMTPKGDAVQLIWADAAQHGWETFGDDNIDKTAPWIEGAWMTKHDGRYYLQYAAPGTQFSSYGDGAYVGASPLGPFEYAKNNPVSLKPGGFINGAGHGTTFQDFYGNYWHMATMRISVKHSFERRLGLFPAGFDADGEMFCNTSFGDYPTHIATGKWDPWKDSFRGWMLLSYHKPATASSMLKDHGPELAVNEDIRDYFSAATGNAGEWLQIDLGKPKTAQAVQINFAEQDCDQYGRDGDTLFHQYLLQGSVDGDTWFNLIDKRQNQEDVPHDYVEFAKPTQVRYVKLTNTHMPANGKFAVAGLRIFGRGDGKAPEAVTHFTAERDPADGRHVALHWSAVAGATGYNVWWGHQAEKLYHNWMVYGQNDLDLHDMEKEGAVWFRVDTFNENGVTPGTVQQTTAPR